MTISNIEDQFDSAHQKLSRIRREIGKVVFGQDEVIDRILITLISGGHGLLVGVPGLAKTLLVGTAARAMGLDTNRVQCTPDLMPADILGSEVLDENEHGKRAFRFIKGPIFTQFLMADEINRASPRTQSALLQAMQEHRVTVSGTHYDLPKPFHVLATQNPIEQEGTYPLPEAQLDRFLMQIDVGYPSREAEKDMLMATTGNETPKTESVLSGTELMEIQGLVRAMPIGQSVVDGILNLVRRARPDESAPDIVNEFVEWPPGPRAAQALMLTSRARALIDGRAAPSMDDVIALAPACLKHRMALNYKARAEGVDTPTIIAKITAGL